MVLRRLLVLFCIASIVAAVVPLLMWWAERWDNPPVTAQSVEGEILYQGHPLHVTITCKCPEAFLESDEKELSFRVHVGGLPLPKTIQLHETLINNGVSIGGHAQVKKPVLQVLTPSISVHSNVNSEDSDFQDDLRTVEETGVTHRVRLRKGRLGSYLNSIDFTFRDEILNEIGMISWPLKVRSAFKTAAAPFVYTGALFISSLIFLFIIDWRLRVLRQRTERRLSEAKSQAEANPERARFAWEVAKVKLEAYFDRNLLQVNLVFWVAVFVMMVGFGFVLWGVFLSLHDSERVTPTSLVAAISGIITQFIGATFMVIYRSTMTQANQFMTVLERINSVGMAVQVLDSIPEAEGSLKNKTRAGIVELLLRADVGPTRSSDADSESFIRTG